MLRCNFCSALRNYDWQCSGNHMRCQRLNLDKLCARQVPYLLEHLSRPYLWLLPWSKCSLSASVSLIILEGIICWSYVLENILVRCNKEFEFSEHFAWRWYLCPRDMSSLTGILYKNYLNCWTITVAFSYWKVLNSIEDQFYLKEQSLKE